MSVYVYEGMSEEACSRRKNVGMFRQRGRKESERKSVEHERDDLILFGVYSTAKSNIQVFYMFVRMFLSLLLLLLVLFLVMVMDG